MNTEQIKDGVDRYIRIVQRAARLYGAGHRLQTVGNAAWVKYLDPQRKYI